MGGEPQAAVSINGGLGKTNVEDATGDNPLRNITSSRAARRRLLGYCQRP